MKYLFLVLAASVVFMAAFASCGIESIEVIPKLSAPLGVSLSNVGGGDNGINVFFYAENDESYLEGYNIYIAMNPVDLQTIPISGTAVRALRIDNTTNIPTMPNIPFMTTPQLLSTTVHFFTNNGSFQVGLSYYFCVKAYSGTYIIESRGSDIESIVYATN